MVAFPLLLELVPLLLLMSLLRYLSDAQGTSLVPPGIYQITIIRELLDLLSNHMRALLD